MSNVQVIADYIKESGKPYVTSEWMLWALEMVKFADENGVTINPEWLRADLVFEGDNEPPMFPKLCSSKQVS